MRSERDEYRWRKWFAWRPVVCNTDGIRPNRVDVWLEWVYRAKRWGFDGNSIFSCYTYLTPEKYQKGQYDRQHYYGEEQ